MEKYKKPKGKRKPIAQYFVFRVCRKPYPSGNWCPRYAIVKDQTGRVIIEASTNSHPVAACNVIHYLRETLKADWSQIHDFGEVEVTVQEFKRYEK